MSTNFTVGQTVICNGYDGTVTTIGDGQLAGMVDVRVPGGITCVSATELARFNDEKYRVGEAHWNQEMQIATQPTTLTAINQQTLGPLFVAEETSIASSAVDVFIADCSTDTASLQAEAPHTARLLAASYTAFDGAGRALGIDATTMAESLGPQGLAAVVRALEALANWGREFTSPTDANSPHDLLINGLKAAAAARSMTMDEWTRSPHCT
ncbi:hypothetical protein [Azospirillum canadense]|uniref:hypothetical protein n=1 Tax=Azospirillum canadense TaxID=403962 RepID=UPI0022260666|nr:hypothetical protein [Azospirillum canadense]MCW2240749.1 hypothetical protein [Azospirillum canadense]